MIILHIMSSGVVLGAFSLAAGIYYTSVGGESGNHNHETLNGMEPPGQVSYHLSLKFDKCLTQMIVDGYLQPTAI